MSMPFFRPDGRGGFIANEVSRGPWDSNSLHGRVVAGLLAQEIESRWGEPSLHCARLTVDLYKMPTFGEIGVSSNVVRDGRRIRLVDGEFMVNGTAVGRASAVLLRRSENPTGTVWSPPDWDVPAPDALPPSEEMLNGMWETRVIDHGFGSVMQKHCWIREVRQLVEGVELTPFVRAALAADFTNPFANSGSAGLQFVNADITLYLHRPPAGEWLGFQVTAHHSDSGIAVGECALYDEHGAIGRSIVCGLANSRR